MIKRIWTQLFKFSFIVFLILAGASILMITGDNSILQRTIDVKINVKNDDGLKVIDLSSNNNGLSTYNEKTATITLDINEEEIKWTGIINTVASMEA